MRPKGGIFPAKGRASLPAEGYVPRYLPRVGLKPSKLSGGLVPDYRPDLSYRSESGYG